MRATVPRERSHAERMAATDGYFEPGSVIRRIGNSPLTPFLGGGPAVLLQVAHPLVAAGVTQHSGYRDDLWRRLLRTLQALYLIVYGSKQEAELAGAAVQRVHARVNGVTRERLGRFPAGTRFSASDPELMLWVHATLVETSLAVFQRFAGALASDEQEAYHREMNTVARLFGVPARTLPPTLGEFRDYLRAQLDGPDLTVTRPAREVARVILRAPLPQPMRLMVPAHRLATAAFLPARLRAEYGLAWSPARNAALHLAGQSLRLAAAPLLMTAARIAPRQTLAARGVPAGGRPQPADRGARI